MTNSQEALVEILKRIQANPSKLNWHRAEEKDVHREGYGHNSVNYSAYFGNCKLTINRDQAYLQDRSEFPFVGTSVMMTSFDDLYVAVFELVEEPGKQPMVERAQAALSEIGL